MIYRQEAEKREEQTLYPKAAFSKQHHRFLGPEEDHRLPYKRDVDRIVYSKAYARYSDKTQVVYLVENDHITHRSLHVQLVSHFARGVAEILRLNLDLVEAISLGHDVGHPPFGHEGEAYLSQLSHECGHGYFAHPWQSCRLFTEIEPLNLGLAVYDGFLCHDGGLSTPRYEPRFGKTWEEHFTEKKEKIADPERNIWPATLEGCLVKLCDTVSYLGRDLEDAISLKILSRDQIPDSILGRSNREILSTVARDIIEQSYERDYIAISDPILEALLQLRAFNFEHIYVHPRLKVESKKIERSYRYLFTALLQDYEKQQEKSYLSQHYLKNKSKGYLNGSTPVQKVIDYISGMTDSFFIRTLERFLVPHQIDFS
jgi:dGTPase